MSDSGKTLGDAAKHPRQINPAVEPRVSARTGLVNRYRCYACTPSDAGGKMGFEFVAAKDHAEAACPSCGTKINSPRGKTTIHVLELIHFEPRAVAAEGSHRAMRPAGTDGAGMYLDHGDGTLACNSTARARGQLVTGSPGAVTCDACKGSDAFKRAQRAALNPSVDIPVSITEEGVEFLGMPAGGVPDLAESRETVAALEKMRKQKGR